PLENPPGIDTGLAVRVDKIETVAKQATRLREIRKGVDSRKRIVCGQSRELFAPGDEEPICPHGKGINGQLTDSRKSRVEIARTTGYHFMGLHPDRASGRFHLRHLGMGAWESRIGNHGDSASARQ